MTVYLDTSALVKLYYPEPESALVAELVRRERSAIPLTPLHELELANALALKCFRKEIDAATFRKIGALIVDDISVGVTRRLQMNLATLFSESAGLARSLTSRLGCRSLDLLHVCAAQLCGYKRFLTFDDKQMATAVGAGLTLVRLE